MKRAKIFGPLVVSAALGMLSACQMNTDSNPRDADSSVEKTTAATISTVQVTTAPSNLPNPMNRPAKSSAELNRTLGRDGSQSPDYSAVFSQQIARIPMRDGVELHTEIYRPRNQTQKLPIILLRTPYGLAHTDNGYTARLRKYPELVREGYIFVFQDTRGRNASDGEYVTLSPIRDRLIENSTDESTDAYDTTDWLIDNLSDNNGRVGTLGISYGGFLTTRALVDPHPALRATSPQATCADMFIGDDWHHNGAFRLDYSFGWISAMEADMAKGGGMPGKYDHYEGFLELGPLSNINKKIFHGKAPSWNKFTEHPNLDEYWIYGMCGVLPHIQPVTVPTLNVLGWFDAEDFYGPLEVYKKYETTDQGNLNYLVIGPWHHGGWSFDRLGDRLGAIDFGSNTSEWFRDHIQGPWFAYWLKDKGAIDFPEVRVFRTGANVWEEYQSWPPVDRIVQRNLYFQAGGRLSFEPPPTALDAGLDAANDPKLEPGYDNYISDPANPVPYRVRPITYDGWAEWQLEDQRLADGRPDVLSYVSDPLQEDVTFTGEPVAMLYAATSGSDSDWIVKLIDVYPEQYEPEPYMGGFKFMIAGEVFRARYRNSFAVPEPVTPGAVTRYEINLRSRNHTFKAGHRIMVQVQSTWFPLIDRNPQRYVESIYEAVEGDFQKATQSIYRSGEFASHIRLPVNTR